MPDINFPGATNAFAPEDLAISTSQKRSLDESDVAPQSKRMRGDAIDSMTDQASVIEDGHLQSEKGGAVLASLSSAPEKSTSKSFAFQAKSGKQITYKQALQILHHALKQLNADGKLSLKMGDLKRLMRAMPDFVVRKYYRVALSLVEAKAICRLLFKNSGLSLDSVSSSKLWRLLKTQFKALPRISPQRRVKEGSTLTRTDKKEKSLTTDKELKPSYSPKEWKTRISEQFKGFSNFLGNRSESDIAKFAGVSQMGTGSFANDSKDRFAVLLSTATELNDLSTISKADLVAKLAKSPVWRQTEMLDTVLSPTHLAGLMMLGNRVEFTLADGPVSAAEILQALAESFSQTGVNKANRFAAKELFERMEAVKEFAVDRLGWYELAIPLSDEEKELLIKVEAEHGRGVAKELFTLMHVSTREFDEQMKSNPSYSSEMKGRLTLLRKELKESPQNLIDKIVRHKDDPMYQHMGVTTFMSMLLKSHANKAALPENLRAIFGDSKKDELQQVALYGYTTGDYVKLNEALRDAKGVAIADVGKNTYAQYVVQGMSRLPEVHFSEDKPLKRAIFKEPEVGWGLQKFKEGSEYTDFGFASCTPDLQAKGTWNLQFSTDVAARDIGPFSAFPGEKEYVVLPGTTFVIPSGGVTGNSVILTPST